MAVVLYFIKFLFPVFPLMLLRMKKLPILQSSASGKLSAIELWSPTVREGQQKGL